METALVKPAAKRCTALPPRKIAVFPLCIGNSLYFFTIKFTRTPSSSGSANSSDRQMCPPFGEAFPSKGLPASLS